MKAKKIFEDSASKLEMPYEEIILKSNRWK